MRGILGRAETTKALLDAGADIEAKNSHEDTALQCAVSAGHLATVRQLLERSAVIENKNDERFVPRDRGARKFP
ncbi:unnamed protein product [Heligmosomoides polygyrus]|uniref:ANK_REP_REGION domain-containing protein n=1 Tax=Heligmosomoides polygyrus TaxID=6339 RepID=A0A183GL64_HELPZ|nr:unnamed protein product [Heligmosomoides polygyrus]